MVLQQKSGMTARGRAMTARVLGLVLLSLLPFLPRPAAAQCTNCLCEIAWQSAIEGELPTLSAEDIAWFNLQMPIHESVFMDQYFFVDHILDAMQAMTEQLTTASMQQMAIIGGFLDAQQQLDVQRLIEEKTAQAHKDYQPSMDLCTIGTAARGLAAASANGALSASILGDRTRDREIQAQDTMGANSDADIASRTQVFLKRYCDPTSENGALAGACPTPAPAATVDKDVSVHRTIWQPSSLNLNFADTTATDDETDVLALNANLYAHRTFPILPDDILKVPTNQTVVLDERAVMAKRSVAENSFGALVAMKTADAATGNSQAYMQMVLKQLGVGGTTNPDWAIATGNPPSYDSSMQILTKRIYEDPRFYTNLYDTPANLARKGAAIRAIGLMQHWDMYNSRLRSEALLAELVELDVEKAQKDVENRMNSNVSEGEKVKQ